jgi:ABC-2 type transport system ATP-binding protein
MIMATQKNIIVESKELTKRYGSKTVVKGVSFSVEEGEIFGILGPNGAGKTTTLEMIETLRPIDGGSATVAGFDVATQPDQIRHIIGVQTQASAFMDKVTLREQLVLQISIYGIKDTSVEELLGHVQLTEHAGQYPEKLSGGQKQRFSIAMALVNTPRVLFLDEPTTGLDPQARRNMWDLIKNLKSKGITIILTSHYMEEAELLCDRLAIMDDGEIIALDTPDKLVQDLLDTGFKKEKQVKQADLEDVFINLTGKVLRD